MSKKTLYISFDIETDGPTPLVNNMLSIGLVGIDSNLEIHWTFESNIEPLEFHSPDSTCMEFWTKPENKTAYDHMFLNRLSYYDSMYKIGTELNTLSQKYNLIFVAQPACFDWMFFKSYYEYSKKMLSDTQIKNMYNLGFKCECISTLWTCYKKINKITNKEGNKLYNNLGNLDASTEHMALSDAIVQGTFYVKLLKLLKILE
jgi:hypothetical protein